MATNSSNYGADLALALSMADAADQISLTSYRSPDLQVSTKPDLTPVTEADQQVERTLRELIAAQRPDDVVAGEEYGGFTETGLPEGRVWVIDPIDGTKNYVRGVPVWATLIALVVDGVAQVGVVSAPALGRRWWATPGEGAYVSDRNGLNPEPQRISVSAVSTLADASLSYSDPEGWDTQPGGVHGLTALQDQCWRSRAYGDFWSHLLVAEGAVDVAAEPELAIWDVAALIPIVREAGGTMTGFAGDDPLLAGSALSTNTQLHPAAKGLIAGR